jgi:hypothetical protein
MALVIMSKLVCEVTGLQFVIYTLPPGGARYYKAIIRKELFIYSLPMNDRPRAQLREERVAS